MRKIGLTVLAASSILAASAQAATVFSDNFDTENGGLTQTNYTGFANWTVSNGSVDLIRTPNFGLDCNTNGAVDLCVDLDGSTNNAGDMTSSVLALAANSYTLTFDLRGNQRGGANDTVTINMSVGGLISDSITLTPGAPYATYSYSFAVAGLTNASIVFSHAGNDNVGILLDNVLLESVEVPEPGALALLGLGLAGLGIARRRH